MNISERYSRQTILPDIGESGQEKLSNASVLVVGCGGLGCASLPYLVSSGIGKIGIIDGDKIELSNLQRQTLFSEEDINNYKVIAAQKRMSNQNSNVEISAYNMFLNARKALELFPQYDIILDATDRIKMRYLISDACVLTNKPFVHASIEEWNGQLSVFNYNNGPNYRDIYPEEDLSAPNCAEVGVMGSAVGIMGSLQAQEVIKIILELNDVLSGKLLVLNTLNLEQNLISFSKTDQKELNEKEYLNRYCNSPKEYSLNELNLSESVLIDVREKGEEPLLESNIVQLVPLSTMEEAVQLFKPNKNYYLFCQSGMRSRKALQTLSNSGLENIFLLKEQAMELAQLQLSKPLNS